MRKRAAIVLNLLIAGTGIIVAWREWLGAAVVWIAGQVLLGRRLPDLSNPQIERVIERLREEAIGLSN